MTPTGNVLDMNDEQQQIAQQWAKETAAGGSPSADLVAKMNDRLVITNAEKFRAQKIVERHNYDVISRVTDLLSNLKSWGRAESEVPAYMLHPILWKVDSYDDGFGGQAWTWAIDKPYDGAAA